ncbi:MAG: cyclin-dependent kinase inhibitor 3 family protein [Mizugakiibacter sp.]|uniref:cyclin-dependent kinase inhibitor 3 family protein n=1 Tax=Mizugakiibacter sp. TaxID=1972610 RepID=UPI0031BD0903|nr:cyclin-dependent kinase inhibitor 3 family protein [Xanthomonadaceae bacterium]
MTSSDRRHADMCADLEAIRQWGANDLITLLEPHEFEELGILDLPERAQAHGLAWHGLPITDGHAPDDRFLSRWSMLAPQWMERLQRGQRIVVHCKGGLGRAGTVACLFLLDTGSASSADEAIQQVRLVRPGAIETRDQEVFLQDWFPRGNPPDAGGHA